MNIVWSPEAIQDLVLLRAYIAEDSHDAAQRVALRILHDVEHLLPDNPHKGRPGRVAGTRELVVPKTAYIVPYRVEGETIQILRVYHRARRWPDIF
jgi:toxin ParE1/3/4